MLADSIVLPSEGKDRFCNEEAKALLIGLLLYVALDPREKDARTSGRVPDITVADDTTLKVTLGQMYESDDCQKHGDAQGEQGTGYACERVCNHIRIFLGLPEDPGDLSRSDFRFEDLKEPSRDDLSRFAARAFPQS